MDESIFSSKLGSNYAPTEQEQVLLMEILSKSEPKVRARLAQLQEEIDRAYFVYKNLCNQYAALSRKFEDHRALLSPIRRLPVDLIREIFLHCLPTEHNSLMSSRECPLLLTQVCSDWRSIAHSTASLWASIHIVIPTTGATNRYTPLSSEPILFPVLNSVEMMRLCAVGVEEWLERSRECLLSISVYNNYTHLQGQIQGSYDRIIDALIDCSSRWQTVDFESIPSRGVEGKIAALSKADVPMLRKLSIKGNLKNKRWRISSAKQSGNPFWLDSGILAAPQLREISYSHATEDFTRFPLKWSQLTAISLVGSGMRGPKEDIYFSKIVDLLRACPSLRECTCDIPRMRSQADSVSESIPIISLLHLRLLSVQSDIQDLGSLLAVLDTPSLREVEFFTYQTTLGVSKFEFFASPLILFLTRVSNALQKLTINPFTLTKNQFFRALQSCPHVTALHLQDGRDRWTQAWNPYRSLAGQISPPLIAPQGWTLDDASNEDSQGYMADGRLLSSFTKPEYEGAVLLPELTDFECLVNGIWSDSTIVDFVAAKCSPERAPGVAPLKRIVMPCYISHWTPEIVEKLRQFVHNGLDCRLNHNPNDFQPVSYHASDGIFVPSRIMLNDPNLLKF